MHFRHRLIHMAIAGKSHVRIDKFTKYRVALIAIALMFVGACSEQGANVSDVGNEPPLSVERSVGFDGDIIRLGVIANLSGPGSSLDRTRLTGVTAYWSDINASGGVGGRYAVELEILDHGGNPEVAEGLVSELLDEVVALTFIDETAMGAVHPFLVEGQVLGVAPTSTLDWESDPRFLTHSPPVEAVVLALFESTPSSKWCVITDGSPLGVGVRNSAPQAARIAGAQSVTLIEVEEDLNAAILAAACEHVFAEVSEKFQEKLVTSIPASRTVLRQAGLTDPIVGRTDIQFAYIDSGPAWHVDAAVGMRPFLASLLRHAPDAKPDTRMRDGYVSQIRLHELLEQAVRGGDLRRSTIFEAAQTHARIEMFGLAEEVDMSIEQPSLPRQMSVRIKVTEEDELDARDWKFERGLRPQNFASLANEILD